MSASSFAVDGPVGSTMMMCFPEEVSMQEMAYLAFFEPGRNIGWAILDDGSLELKDADSGDVFATYEAVLEASADPVSFSEQKSGAIAFSGGTAVAALAMSVVVIFVSML